MKLVEAVIINWKRPANVARMIAALRLQTEPCTITVCDCHPSTAFALDEDTRRSIDRLYAWSHNLGPFSRFVPLAAYDHRFTLFIDDDMLPGTRCVEHFLQSAAGIGRFGVLGQQGRILESDGLYRYDDVHRTSRFIETDVIIRGYFVPTEHLPHILQFRRMMACDDWLIAADDLLLCTAIRALAGASCYLTPVAPDAETLLNKEELSDVHALSLHPGHLERRQAFLDRARAAGWIPLRAGGRGDGTTARRSGPVRSSRRRGRTFPPR